MLARIPRNCTFQEAWWTAIGQKSSQGASLQAKIMIPHYAVVRKQCDRRLTSLPTKLSIQVSLTHRDGRKTFRNGKYSQNKALRYNSAKTVKKGRN